MTPRCRRPPPRYRRPRETLSTAEVAELVRRRKAGATWQALARTFGKQESACKVIFDKAQARSERPPAPPAPAADDEGPGRS